MAEDTITLTDGRAVEEYLRLIVEEGSRSAKQNLDVANSSRGERAKQDRMAQAVRGAVGDRKAKKDEVEEDDDLFADEKGGDDKKEKKKDSDSGGDKKKKKSSGLPKHIHTDLPDAEDITVDMIVDRMNVIRSGKSTKDEHVAVEMNHYVDGLSSPEKLALLSFLTGLAQIVTAGIEGEDAPDPGDPDVDVAVKPTSPAGGGKEEKRVKPGKSSGKKSKSKEDTAPPIKVGEAQQTEAIRRKIRRLL